VELSGADSATQEGASLQAQEAYAKYFKMLQMRVPREAVKAKMKNDGIDPQLLDHPTQLVPSKAPKQVGAREAYAKYFKMLQLRVPRGAVEAKMKNQGIDPQLLDHPTQLVPPPREDGILGGGRPLRRTSKAAPRRALTPSALQTQYPNTPLATAAAFFNADRASFVDGIKGLRLCYEGASATIQSNVAAVEVLVGQQLLYSTVLRRWSEAFRIEGNDSHWYKACGAIRTGRVLGLSPHGSEYAFDELTAVATPHPFFEVFEVFKPDPSLSKATARCKRGVDPASWLREQTVSTCRSLCKKTSLVSRYTSLSKPELIASMLTKGFPYGPWSWPSPQNTLWATELAFEASVHARQAMLQVVAPTFLRPLFQHESNQKLSLAFPSDPKAEYEARLAVKATVVDPLGNASLSALFKLRALDAFATTCLDHVNQWVQSIGPIVEQFNVEAWSVWSFATLLDSDLAEHSAFCHQFCALWTSKRDQSRPLALERWTRKNVTEEEARRARRRAIDPSDV